METSFDTDIAHIAQCCSVMKEKKNGPASSSFTSGVWRSDGSIVNYLGMALLYWVRGGLSRRSLAVKKIPKSHSCVQFSVFAADSFFLKVISYFFSISVCDFLFNLYPLKISHCNIRHCFVSSEENILQNGETHQPWLRSKLLKQGRGYSLGKSVKKKTQ